MALSEAPEPMERPQQGRADSQGGHRWDEEPTREVSQRVARPMKEIVEGGETKGYTAHVTPTTVTSQIAVATTIHSRNSPIRHSHNGADLGSEEASYATLRGTVTMRVLIFYKRGHPTERALLPELAPKLSPNGSARFRSD